MPTIVTVYCPLCQDDIDIPVSDHLDRTDALMGHIISYHGGKIRPQTPAEGPPLPHRFNIKWPWNK